MSMCVNADGVFDNERDGICAHGDYEWTKAAVERLITDESLRRSRGSRASEFARERFSERNMDEVDRRWGVGR